MFDFSFSIDRKNKKLKNCKYEIRLIDYGNITISVNESKNFQIDKNIHASIEDSKKRKTEAFENVRYTTKFSYSCKLNKYLVFFNF